MNRKTFESEAAPRVPTSAPGPIPAGPRLIAFPQAVAAAGSRPAALHLVNSRHRGLHLLSKDAVAKHAEHEDTQAQANRIAAQVEREIERQAERERLHRMYGVQPKAPAPAPLHIYAPVQHDSPVSVARRLLGAMVSFARPASL